jgi:hypothetical protein
LSRRGQDKLERPGGAHIRATKELIAGVFGRAALSYERARAAVLR